MTTARNVAIIDQVEAADRETGRWLEQIAATEATYDTPKGPRIVLALARQLVRLPASVGDQRTCDHVKPGDRVTWPSWSPLWLCASCALAAHEPIANSPALVCDSCRQTVPIDDCGLFSTLWPADLTDPDNIRPGVILTVRLCLSCADADRVDLDAEQPGE